uniref:Uncharacterized protein n=1 Tax=Siphoviridae sp. ctwQg18 TaxID=2826516 RepID=A0A8S5MIS4_9CAUD|nr:MAG TPA: hypothetical protein [Siphoviridae sp. ctwQg18]
MKIHPFSRLYTALYTEPCRAVRKDEFSWLNTNYRIKRLS